VIAFIGLFNIIGSIAAGILGSKLPKRYLLCAIYFLRAVAITGFLLVPVTPTSALGVRRRDGRAVALHRAADLRSRRR
jgi:hypothetical protein